VALSDLFDRSSSHVMALLLLIQFNDASAYLVGKRLGKTKLAFVSALSPNKTLEGYAAGAVATIVAAFILHLVIPAYPAEGMALRTIALVTSVFFLGNAGDLAFSSMKRRIGVKDFSNVLAGHGGIMDRFDSILCLAPLYLCLTGALI
jgi:phosphatidate cytidylyltransferase